LKSARARGLTIFAVAVVLVYGAGLGIGRQAGSLADLAFGNYIAGRYRGAVIVSDGAGAGTGNDGSRDQGWIGDGGGLGHFCDGRGVGVELAVVVVIGVALHVEIPAVGKLSLDADILEVGGHLIVVVLIVKPVGGVAVVDHHEVVAVASVGLNSVGRGVVRGAADGGGCGAEEEGVELIVWQRVGFRPYVLAVS